MNRCCSERTAHLRTAVTFVNVTADTLKSGALLSARRNTTHDRKAVCLLNSTVGAGRNVDAKKGKYRLRSCLWELTLKCNMRCMHCGSAAGRARSSELTLDQCLAVADELGELGCANWLHWREIFLYKGWERIARTHRTRDAREHHDKRYSIGEEEVRQISTRASVTSAFRSTDWRRTIIGFGKKELFRASNQRVRTAEPEGIAIGPLPLSWR